MSGEVDYYDVQAMIRDARTEIMAEVRAEILSCSREILAEARQQIRDESEAILRVVNSRTERLA